MLRRVRTCPVLAVVRRNSRVRTFVMTPGLVGVDVSRNLEERITPESACTRLTCSLSVHDMHDIESFSGGRLWFCLCGSLVALSAIRT